MEVKLLLLMPLLLFLVVVVVVVVVLLLCLISACDSGAAIAGADSSAPVARMLLSKLLSCACLQETEPHFIRCIKPNDQQQPKLFIESKVLPQLRALSIMEAIQLRSVGYSYR